MAYTDAAGPQDLDAGQAPRLKLRRRPDEGLLGGVCAGIARRMQVNVIVVRLLGALTTGLGGLGVVMYALAWALLPVAPESRGVPRRPGAWREGIMIVAGVIVLDEGLRSIGIELERTIFWPLVLGGCGVALVWRPALGTGEETPAQPQSRRRRLLRTLTLDAPRTVVGALLVAISTAVLLHQIDVVHRSLAMAVGAVAIVGTIFTILFVPWFLRQGRSVAFERAGRIRERERAEVAAHLHDSVLQTLALIQKRAADPREVAGLARRQERELRSWLQGRRAEAAGESAAVALERAAAEVEERHGVPVEAVTVGDARLSPRTEALVGAAREAMTNAAKFAGGGRIDLYAEFHDGRAEVFVRDRGVGFDPAAVPADRRGVRDSIVGRMQRHHGRAAVRSVLGEGTEVELAMEG